MACIDHSHISHSTIRVANEMLSAALKGLGNVFVDVDVYDADTRFDALLESLKTIAGIEGAETEDDISNIPWQIKQRLVNSSVLENVSVRQPLIVLMRNFVPTKDYFEVFSSYIRPLVNTTMIFEPQTQATQADKKACEGKRGGLE